MQLHPAWKWVANFCFISGTISLLNPQVAATSVTPWIIHFIGNSIWAVDSKLAKNTQWFIVAIFFSTWNILLIASRIYGIEVFAVFEPIIKLMGRLP